MTFTWRDAVESCLACALALTRGARTQVVPPVASSPGCPLPGN